MENEPPSLIVHPFDAVAVHVQVPIHVPVRGGGLGLLNVAVTDLFEFMVMSIERLELLASPLQPTKVEPVAGVAVKVTTVPLMYVGPRGSIVTVPLPVPADTIVSIKTSCEVI